MKPIRIILFLSVCMLLSVFARAEAREIEIKEGASKIIRAEKARDVEVLKKEIASATVLSEEEVLIDAKKAGTTIVNINNGKTTESVLVTVKKQSSADSMIEVDVQVLEIVHNDEQNYGLDWPALLQGPLPENGLPVSPMNAIEVTPNSIKALGATFNRGQMNLLVDFLVKNNYAKILARPKLLTANGKKAKFLSGGEVPLVTVNTQGQASVDWKKYGVSLEISPTLNKQGGIEADLKTEVSTLDYANAVDLGKSIMPAIKTRWVETNLNMEQGNTMVIAGLIEDHEMKVTSGVPVLSGIPLLGELFKNTSTSIQKTELVIFVTPKVVGQEIAQ